MHREKSPPHPLFCLFFEKRGNINFLCFWTLTSFIFYLNPSIIFLLFPNYYRNANYHWNDSARSRHRKRERQQRNLWQESRAIPPIGRHCFALQVGCFQSARGIYDKQVATSEKRPRAQPSQPSTAIFRQMPRD